MAIALSDLLALVVRLIGVFGDQDHRYPGIKLSPLESMVPIIAEHQTPAIQERAHIEVKFIVKRLSNRRILPGVGNRRNPNEAAHLSTFPLSSRLSSPTKDLARFTLGSRQFNRMTDAWLTTPAYGAGCPANRAMPPFL